MRWTRLALIPFGLICLSCAGPGSVVPPLTLIRPARPPIVDEDKRITDEGIAWIGELANAYVLNCTALSVLRGEDVRQCRRGLERDAPAR